MRRWIMGLAGLGTMAAHCLAATPDGAASAPPAALAWAYPVAPPQTSALAIPPGVYVTPDGKRKLNAAQVEALNTPDEDWFPDSHPHPPDVILRASKNGAAPCAECHLVNGQGEVGIPDLAGLQAHYLSEQLDAFRSGTRKSAQPGRVATEAMIEVAKSWSEPDLKAAAAYFAGLPRRTAIRMVVAEEAPALRTDRFGWTYADRAGGRRALNGAVAEAPESVAKLFMGDPSNLEVVYASRATLASGEALVRSGGGGGQPCAVCHGADLRGTPIAPALAGRDPGYLARQLWDIRSGTRSGPGVAVMQAPARGLSPRDITAVAAYLSSRSN